MSGNHCYWYFCRSLPKSRDDANTQASMKSVESSVERGCDASADDKSERYFAKKLMLLLISKKHAKKVRV